MADRDNPPSDGLAICSYDRKNKFGEFEERNYFGIDFEGRHYIFSSEDDLEAALDGWTIGEDITVEGRIIGGVSLPKQIYLMDRYDERRQIAYTTSVSDAVLIGKVMKVWWSEQLKRHPEMKDELES